MVKATERSGLLRNCNLFKAASGVKSDTAGVFATDTSDQTVNVSAFGMAFQSGQ